MKLQLSLHMFPSPPGRKSGPEPDAVMDAAWVLALGPGLWLPRASSDVTVAQTPHPSPASHRPLSFSFFPGQNLAQQEPPCPQLLGLACISGGRAV